jgi:TPR repeat protein
MSTTPVLAAIVRVICLAMILALPPGPAPGQTVDFGRYHALVIGNNDYAHLPKLKNAVADAQAVERLLKERYGFDTTLLLNATRDQIVRALNDQRAALTEADNLLIYYAGHGTLDGDVGFWQGIDAEPKYEDNWVPNSDLTRNLRAMSARHVLVVADSCYSGTLTRDASASLATGEERQAWLQRMAGQRSRTAMSSGDLDKVLDGGGRGHSIFAGAFLDALGTNQGVLDGQALFDNIKGKIVRETVQTPQYSDIQFAEHRGGDFLFVPREVQMAALAEQQNFGPQRGGGGELGDDFKVWSVVQHSTNPIDLETFIATFPDSIWIRFARNRLAKLDASSSPEETASSSKMEWQDMGAPGASNPGEPYQPEVESGVSEDPNEGVDAPSPLQGESDVNECDLWAADVADEQSAGLGVMFDDINPDRAIPACRDAVERSPEEVRFAYQYARALAKSGGEENDAEAVNWFRKAADLDHRLAMTFLGWMYAEGRGVARDDAEAVRWYRKAAEKGDAFGGFYLGWAYRDGRGVTPDDAEAVRWYREAADKGNGLAMAHLGWMYAEGRGVARDDAEAVRWYRRAVERAAGGAEAWTLAELGWMYADGRGVTRDSAEAARLLRIAADKGHIAAARKLGWMYLEADGVARDYAEALRLTRVAAEAGDALAMNNLGWMYERGLGLRQDREEAVRWYRKAAEQGESFANENLARLGR